MVAITPKVSLVMVVLVVILSMTNLVSTAGVVATDVTSGVGTSRM